MKSYPDPFTSAPSCILDIIPRIETSTFLFAVDHGRHGMAVCLLGHRSAFRTPYNDLSGCAYWETLADV